MTYIIRILLLLPTIILTLITGLIFSINAVVILTILGIFKKDKKKYFKDGITSIEKDLHYIIEFILL